MTNVATLLVAMVGSVLVVSVLTWRLVRGVPEGYDSETEVRTPLVTVRRKVQRSERCTRDADAVQVIDLRKSNVLPATRTDLEAVKLELTQTRKRETGTTQMLSRVPK
jgi:hypothetical protein